MPSFLVAAIACVVASLPATMNLPLVDPGLFVLTGVKACGNSSGYCMLGNNCTTDDDFLPDSSGNCDGLKQAFTPSAPFACCMFNGRSPPQPPTKDSNVNKKTPNFPKKAKNEWPRITREHIDPLQMDSEQLEKLNQIGFVVKKIVEQLLNETANTIRDDTTSIENNTAVVEANTIRNDNIEVRDGVEITETITVNPSTDSPSDDDSLRTEIVPPLSPENKEDSNPMADKVDESDTVVIEPAETSDSTVIDDEFRYEKNICQKTCKSEMMFTVDKKPLCYGTLLDEIWILTSATCASRVNKAGIRKVAAIRKDWYGPMLSISNLLVHENFKYPVSKNSPDNNNLALASLNESLLDQPCIPCFTQRKNLTNEVCRSFQNTYYNKNTIKSADYCEGQVQLRKLVVNSYYVLPCSRWRMQYNQEGRLGSGLWCDGKLAGVQTGVGVGSLIYTPVNEYGQWISDNKRIERRR